MLEAAIVIDKWGNFDNCMRS